MIRIDCFTRDGCDACKIAIKNITDAINEANCDITLNIRNTNLDDILRKEITKFPTTVITKVDNDYKRKELARLEGSFPSIRLLAILPSVPSYLSLSYTTQEIPA